MKSILCCEFPTTVLWVDDSKDLHAALSLSLPPDKGPYRFLNDSREALGYIQKQTPLLTGKHLSYADCPVGHELHFRANLGELKFNADRSSKSDKISVVFMDYQMPGMNGLEVLEQVASTCIEKILLTGFADEKIAVEAFNRGLINRYIAKKDPELVQLIIDAISIGKQNYFQRSTQTLYNLLTQDYQETALMDPLFIEFFSNLKEKLNIVEYYLLDGIGSFLMFDSKGVRHKLNTYTKERYLSLLETLPEQHRSIKTIKGRQLYYCMLNSGLTQLL